MRKITGFILLCVLIISLSACSNSTDISGSPKSLYDNNNSIDFLVYDDTAYINASNIEWIAEFELESDEKLGEIKRTNITKKFKDFDATVLAVGTEFYSVLGSKSGDLILVYIDDVAVPYYAYIEG